MEGLFSLSGVERLSPLWVAPFPRCENGETEQSTAVKLESMHAFLSALDGGCNETSILSSCLGFSIMVDLDLEL